MKISFVVIRPMNRTACPDFPGAKDKFVLLIIYEWKISSAVGFIQRFWLNPSSGLEPLDGWETRH